jgi:iron complex transport system permease protein
VFRAVLTFYFGLAEISFALPLGGIVGAFVATLVLFVLASGWAGTMTLILAGTAIHSFAEALATLALNL